MLLKRENARLAKVAGIVGMFNVGAKGLGSLLSKTKTPAVSRIGRPLDIRPPIAGGPALPVAFG